MSLCILSLLANDLMLGSVLRDLRSTWLQLAIVDSLYKLLAFLVLWPVMGPRPAAVRRTLGARRSGG